MQQLNIETTQHVQIDYLPAGIGIRMGAFFIDFIVLGIYYAMVFGLILEFIASSTWITILLILPGLFYHLICEILLDGQSLGKKAVEIKVIRTDGMPASISSYLLRWMFRMVEITATSGLLAFFTVLINGHGQRLGDIAAGTTVVKIQPTTSLSDTLYSAVEEGYAPVYSQAATLSDDDIALIREVLNIGDEYDSDVRFRMLHKISTAVQKKMGVQKNDETDTKKFLKTVIKDYNFLQG